MQVIQGLFSQTCCLTLFRNITSHDSLFSFLTDCPNKVCSWEPAYLSCFLRRHPDSPCLFSSSNPALTIFCNSFFFEGNFPSPGCVCPFRRVNTASIWHRLRAHLFVYLHFIINYLSSCQSPGSAQLNWGELSKAHPGYLVSVVFPSLWTVLVYFGAQSAWMPWNL